MKEITLTEKQIQNVLAGHKEIDAAAAKLPDDPAGKPDPKLLKALDDAASRLEAEYAARMLGASCTRTSRTISPPSSSGQSGHGGEWLAEPREEVAAVAGDTKEIVEEANLGYCELFDFKCAGDRTCDAWITGGPLTDKG